MLSSWRRAERRTRWRTLLKTLDRYLIREIAVPFVIALLVFTFMLQIPVLIREAEALVARGVGWAVIARVLLLLLPSALSLSIPIAVLFGILIGFGRLSADREFVALQACGVSVFRLLRPVAVVAAIGTAATAHQVIVALPAANQSFREIVFQVMAERVENNVRPHVFFNAFPHRVIYVRDLPAGGGWRDVFFADSSEGTITVYFAKEGHIALDRENRQVQLQLIDGTSHATTLSNADSYERSDFESFTISLDPATVFPPPPAKGTPEMTFAELRERIEAAPVRGENDYQYRYMFQQKLALPVTCPILALIGFALGASNRRGGKFASFVLGIAVVFVHYLLLWFARAGAIAGRIDADWAPWLPNIVMGLAAVLLLAWRTRAADQPIRLWVPTLKRRGDGTVATRASATVGARSRRSRTVVVIRLPQWNVPKPRLLDLYVSREYLRALLIGIGGLLGLFYISTFIDLADEMFEGQASASVVLQYFFFLAPQFVYYVLPMAVLVAALVTVGVMSKNNELIVMRACGISLYRTVAPLVMFAALGSVCLFTVQERVLATSNREAERLHRSIRGMPPRASTSVDQWLAGTDGEFYHYDTFDPATNSFRRLWVYDVDRDEWDLTAIAYADRAELARALASEEGFRWTGRDGWVRDLRGFSLASGDPSTVRYTPFSERTFALDAPSYFISEPAVAENMLADHAMTYRQLQGYIDQLQASGSNAMPYVVSLRRKVAFPFVTLIMTILAVPFAVSTGRRGALYGVGLGIVLAIVYWVALSLFGALGEGGMLSPLLAAWAPNILFGAAAVYLVLTVRT